MAKQMKIVQLLLVLLSCVFGCTRTPQQTALIPPGETTTAERQEHKALTRDEQKLIVICQVIGSQSERLTQILKQAGITCKAQGDEFHDISVPINNKQEAVELIAKDVQDIGYEIFWSTQ